MPPIALTEAQAAQAPSVLGGFSNIVPMLLYVLAAVAFIAAPVLVAAVGRCAFLAHDADDEKGCVAHEDILAHGAAAVGKERARHGAAEDHDRGILFHVLGVEELPLGDGPIPRGGKILAGALSRGLVVQVAVARGQPAAALRQRGLDVGQGFERDGILDHLRRPAEDVSVNVGCNVGCNSCGGGGGGAGSW